MKLHTVTGEHAAHNRNSGSRLSKRKHYRGQKQFRTGETAGSSAVKGGAAPIMDMYVRIARRQPFYK